MTSCFDYKTPIIIAIQTILVILRVEIKIMGKKLKSELT